MKVSVNIDFKEDSRFGEYNRQAVFDIIKFVDINMSNCIGQQPFSSSKCLIDYRPDGPMIVKSYNCMCDHIIFLSVSDNYWCQWMYQFAHEYCHHLVNGKMSSELKGCVWFEESLCEAASLFNLIELEKTWRNSSNSAYKNYTNAIGKYIDHLQKKDKSEICTILGGYRKILLYKKDKYGYLCYNRDLYHRVASSLLLPKMIENPSIWKMILHIGDSRSWKSIIDLMDHLVKTADISYLNSIKALKGEFDSIVGFLQE